MLSISMVFISQIALAESAQYNIPDYNAQITIVNDALDYAAFEGASFENNTWFFESRLAGADWGLSFSAKNCKVNITHFNPLSIISPQEPIYHVGYLRYTVEGVGEQTFKMHSNWDMPLKWNVKIDDVQKEQRDGWDYSNGWLTVRNATSKVLLSAELVISPIEPCLDANLQPYFVSSELNSTLSFANAFNFTEPYVSNSNTTFILTQTKYPYVRYFKTISESNQNPSHNAWWYVNNIFLEVEPGATCVESFAVGAYNSNLTLTALNHMQQTLSREDKHATIRVDRWLNYSVSGIGEQSITIVPPQNKHAQDNGNISVYIDGIKRERGDGWQLLEGQWFGQQWLTVTDAKSNVSIHTWDISTHYTGSSLILEPDYSFLWVISAIIACLLISLLVLAKRKKTKKLAAQNIQDSIVSTF